MAEITAQMVKELRERSGAGIMDCKMALKEAAGDLAQAELNLRKRGIAIAQKKSSRAANEGMIGTYIHPGSKLGVLVEMNCETDFVARTDEFQQLVHDVAMHIAATDPQFIRKEDITEEALENEKQVQRARALQEGKPEHVIEKIIVGRMGKFYEEICLLEQPFVKDSAMTIGELITSKIAQLGENITLSRMTRFKVGEAGSSGS